MTKEELYKTIEQKSSYAWYYKELLDEFFSQNVVIPKGENRHPYADVLHEWIEGKSIVADSDGKHFSDVSSAKTKLSGRYSIKNCIKPSAPAYEWQWMFNGEVIDLSFYTESEIKDHTCKRDTWEKIEKTKRERKK